MPARCHRPSSLTAAAVLAVVAVPFAAGGAAAADDAVFTLETVGGAPGDTVRVPLRLSVPGLVGAFDLVAEAGGAIVADVDYTGPIFFAGWDGWDTAPSDTPSIQAACVFPQDQVQGDLPLMDLLVVVPADAEPGSTIPVTLTSGVLWNYSGQTYDLVMVPGGVVVTSGGCDEDLDGDDTIGFDDLMTVLSAWGPCSGPCDADLDGSGAVGLDDLVRVLAAWGPCAG